MSQKKNQSIQEEAKDTREEDESIFVGVTVAAKELGVSRTKFYELCNREDFPATREVVEGEWRIHLEQMREWARQQVGCSYTS